MPNLIGGQVDIATLFPQHNTLYYIQLFGSATSPPVEVHNRKTNDRTCDMKGYQSRTFFPAT